MRVHFLLPLLLWSALTAQTFTPSAITFTGAPAYTSAELIKMSGLTPGKPLDQATIEAALHKLDDTGLFANINYKVERGALRIELEPMGKENTRPVAYTNFVLDTPAELTAAVHDKLPLFTGSVPVNGGMQAGVERALEAVMQEKHHLQSTVSSIGNDKGGLDYSLTMPQVLVGKVAVTGADLAADPKLTAVRDRVQGSPYAEGASGDALTTNLIDAYQDLGYVDFAMGPVTHGTPVVTANTISVDLTGTAQPGALYTASRVDLPAGQEGIPIGDLTRAAQLKAGAPASRIERLSTLARLNDLFTGHGYLDAKTTVQQSKDASAHTVAYVFQTAPGGRYRMHNFVPKGFSPDRAQALAAEWKLAPGKPYEIMALFDFQRSAAARTACPSPLGVQLMPNAATHEVDVVASCH